MFKKLKLEELGRIDLESFKKSDKNNIVLILDNVRSMHNVGSIFRTADGFGIKKIYLCGITAKPPHREIHKTALGAENSMDWEYYENTLGILEKLKSEGFKVIAIEQAIGSIQLNKFVYNGDDPLAIILGNEVEGVSDDVMQIADICIEIPQFGTKHSFNVSVCAGIVLWQFLG